MHSILLIVTALLASLGGLLANDNVHTMANQTLVNGGGNETVLEPTPYPFAVCQGAPTDLDVHILEMDPNPPAKGKDMHLTLLGTVDEQLSDGAYFDVSVSYKGVRIFFETIDLSQATALPVGPGPLALNYSVLIPSSAPSGPYVVQLIFDDQNGAEITCIAVNLSL